MELVYSRTKTIQEDKVSGFCPGCMHSTVVKLIGEALEEMNLVDKAVMVTGIGCCGLHMDYIAYDTITAPHGRACAVATGMKRSNPDTLYFTYQGDGDFASIGLAESVSAANRGENITVIFINNGIYGMTGGQMAPTTLVGMKASTAPKGRIPEEHGYPMHMCEILDKLTAPAYLERTSCNTPQNVIKTKNAIKKAFQNQIDGKGFSMVEIVTSCPTNWGLSPVDSLTCDSTDKNVTFFPSYGAEQRGGTANCFVVISDEMVGAPLGDVMDDLIVMNGPSLQKFLPTLKQGGTLFINSSIVPEEDIDRTDVKVVKAPVTEMALEMGNAKVLNVIMLGVYVGYTEVVSPEVVWGTIEHKLAKKAKLLPLNKEAFEKGLEIGRSQR